MLTVSSMLGLASSVATPPGTCVAYSPPPSTAKKNTAAAATQRFHAPRRRPRSGIGTTFSSSGCCAGACTRAKMALQQSGVSATTSVRSCSSNSLSVKIVTSHRIAQLSKRTVIARNGCCLRDPQQVSNFSVLKPGQRMQHHDLPLAVCECM